MRKKTDETIILHIGVEIDSRYNAGSDTSVTITIKDNDGANRVQGVVTTQTGTETEVVQQVETQQQQTADSDGDQR